MHCDEAIEPWFHKPQNTPEQRKHQQNKAVRDTRSYYYLFRSNNKELHLDIRQLCAAREGPY